MNNVLLIVNTGTPDSPDRRSVRKYLSEFLNDPKVMDMPAIFRKILVNLIIVPFRSSYSTELYQRLWTDKGSPLLLNLEKLVSALRSKSDDFQVIGAMRYGQPSLERILQDLGKTAVNKITVLPLYPQYSESTTGSVRALVNASVSAWEKKPEINFIDAFYADKGFITAYSCRILEYRPENYDHLLFSFHSLPERHVQRLHPKHDHRNCKCNVRFPEYGKNCYKAQCYETSRLIAGALGRDEGTWSVSFQSRLTRNWIGPFTDSVLQQLASEGKKRVLVAAPSFTADCLETLLEIGETYRELFIKAGGEELQLCESLNESDQWVEAIMRMI